MIKNVSLILSGRFKSTQPDGKQFGLPYLRQIRNNTYVDATPEVHPVPVRKSNIHYSFSENWEFYTFDRNGNFFQTLEIRLLDLF